MTAAAIEATAPVPYQLSAEFAYSTDGEHLYMSNGSVFRRVHGLSAALTYDGDVLTYDDEIMYTD